MSLYSENAFASFLLNENPEEIFFSMFIEENIQSFMDFFDGSVCACGPSGQFEIILVRSARFTYEKGELKRISDGATEKINTGLRNPFSPAALLLTDFYSDEFIYYTNKNTHWCLERTLAALRNLTVELTLREMTCSIDLKADGYGFTRKAFEWSYRNP